MNVQLSGSDRAAPGTRSDPDSTPEAGSRVDAPAQSAAAASPASGTYAPTPPPGAANRGGVEAPTRVRPGAALPRGTSAPRRWDGPPAHRRGAERSRPDQPRGRASGREPLPPDPGEPGYSAHIAELSARFGNLKRAFAYAQWQHRGRP